MIKISVKTDEIINSLTHAVGIALSITALVLMVIQAVKFGNTAAVVGAAIFGAGLIVLYSASTIYHAARNLRLKVKLNKFDHSAIYVLIAATYTPVTLVTLAGTWGWTIFGIIWGTALVGIIYKVFFYSAKYRFISTMTYIGMGLVAVIAVKPLIHNMPTAGLWWLAAGGAAYIIGAVFYLFRKLPLNHGIFHLFVIAGSFAHFWTVYHYILPVSQL